QEAQPPEPRTWRTRRAGSFVSNLRQSRGRNLFDRETKATFSPHGVATALVLHGGEVALGGTGDLRFGVAVHDAAEAVVHAVVGERFCCRDDRTYFRRPERDVIRI